MAEIISEIHQEEDVATVEIAASSSLMSSSTVSSVAISSVLRIKQITRPNYFIGLTFDRNSSLENTVRIIHSSVVENNPTLTRFLQPLPKLHITLALLTIQNDDSNPNYLNDSINSIVSTMQTCASGHFPLKDSSTSLRLAQLNNFGSRVLYLQPEDKDTHLTHAKLLNFAQNVCQNLQQFYAKPSDPLHLTLINQRKKPSLRKSNYENIDEINRELPCDVLLRSIELFKIGSTDANTLNYQSFGAWNFPTTKETT